MRLILVRHGETRGNVLRMLQGAEDPLTERGRRQAEELASHLAGREDVRALYTSPYPRALETARAIGCALGLEPVQRAGLAEVDVGEAAGWRFEEWAEAFPGEAEKFRVGGLDYAWPKGESGRDVAARTAAELDRVLDAHRTEGGAVVIVSHGGALAWVISRLLREPGDEWPFDHARLENCSITEAEVLDGAPANFLYKNDVAHLSPDPDEEAATGQDPAN